MSEFVDSAKACVSEAHRSAYSGFNLQSELLLSGIVKMTELSTMQGSYRTAMEADIIDNVLAIRSNQIDLHSTLLDIHESLKLLIELQQHTNELLEKKSQN